MNNDLSGLTQQANPNEVIAELKAAYQQVYEENKRLREAIPSSKLKELISDDLLDQVWGYANFGSISKREVVRDTLLKCASGYYTGRTAEFIAMELGLISRKEWMLTKLGQEYLYEAYANRT